MRPPLSSRGIGALQHLHQDHDLPVYIAEGAEVEMGLGEPKPADSCVQRVTTLVEELRKTARNPRVKDGLASLTP